MRRQPRRTARIVSALLLQMLVTDRSRRESVTKQAKASQDHDQASPVARECSVLTGPELLYGVAPAALADADACLAYSFPVRTRLSLPTCIFAHSRLLGAAAIPAHAVSVLVSREIGRASWRERAQISAVTVS